MIEIVEYSAFWPHEFEALADSLRSALGPLALQIDHVGSTAVPGLCAKDVIDIQINVTRCSSTISSGPIQPQPIESLNCCKSGGR